MLRRATPMVGLALALTCAVSACSKHEEPLEYSTALGPPPGEYSLASDDGMVRIPFELYRDEIMMNGEINGKKARIMIDNGRMWDELLLFGSSRVDSMGLSYAGQLSVAGAGEREAAQSGLAKDVAVAFPGISFTGQTAVVTPQSEGFAEMWEADGQVCGTFFKHFVALIDFDDSIVSLVPPGDFTPSPGMLELPLTQVGDASWAFPGTVVASDGREIPLLLTMDLGRVTALSVAVFEGSPLPVPPDAVEASLGYGIQGEIRGHKARFPALRIGDYTLESVPAGFSATAGNASEDDAVIVGLPVLSRFNVAFDYPHERILIVPNGRFDELFAYEE